MSNASTIRMLKPFRQRVGAPMFLAGMFQSPAENYHTSERVEQDIIRSEEDIAVPVPDLSSGGRQNEATKYVNKSYLPPIYDEIGTVQSYHQINRQAGATPFDDPDYAANAAAEALDIGAKLIDKIRRAIELQAAQVLQLGALTLTDDAGTTVYNADFESKNTHLVTTGTTWADDGATGNPLSDLEALAVVVRRDGKRRPDRLVFGTTAWNRFLANTDVKARLDNRRMELGGIVPKVNGENGTFQGRMIIGAYDFALWSYDADYIDPNGGAATPYIDAINVVMLSSQARLDLTFGAMPIIVSPEAAALPFLPRRVSMTGAGVDMTFHSWVEPNGKIVNVSVGSRPLTIPTEIDTFAKLITTQ